MFGASSELAPNMFANMFGASSELDSVMEFGYNKTIVTHVSCTYKNSSGDETANVNFYAVRPEATRIR